MRIKSTLFITALSTLAIACVTVAPAGSGGPSASSSASATGTNVAPTESTAAATDAATTEAPTDRPAKTPKPTRRPRPTPAEPADIDVSVFQYQIVPYTNDPAAGFHVDLHITIENKGTDKARKFTVAVTCFGYTLNQDVFGGIEGGQMKTIDFGFYTSIAGEGKPNKIVLDSTDRLAETDEENNVHDLSSAPEEYPSSCDREAGNPVAP